MVNWKEIEMEYILVTDSKHKIRFTGERGSLLTIDLTNDDLKEFKEFVEKCL